MIDDMSALANLNQNINNLTSVVAAAGMQNKQHKNNKELLKLEQEWQVYLWRLANEYNLPVNEVKRLLDAGINPAVAFSNGGASAAPIPNPPQAQDSIGNLPNLGNPVLAQTQASVAQSQVELNEATADRQRAEADAARESAGLTDTQNRLATVQADIVEKNRDALARVPVLENMLREITVHLGGNKVVRDDIYTGYFSSELTMNLEASRLNNRLLRKDYERYQAEINLLVSRDKLTLQEAKNLSLQADILYAERYYAQWNYNMSKLINENVYGGADTPNSGTLATMQVIESAKKEAANALARGSLTAVSLNKDLGFETVYGAEARRLGGYEGPRRSVNATRVGQYTSVLSALSGFGMAVASGGQAVSAGRYRRDLIKSLNKTNRDFGLTSPYYRGGSSFVPDYYSPF